MGLGICLSFVPLLSCFHSRVLAIEKVLPELVLSLDDANRFIRMNSLRGKPLEIQYESTRELDMNAIEEELLNK